MQDVKVCERAMKNLEKIEQAFSYFKRAYCYKMGGTQTVILPNGKSKYFDDRQYYSGRGARYNSSIRHDEIGDVRISKKEYSEFLKMLKDREKLQIVRRQKEAKKLARIEDAKSNGVYSIIEEDYGTFVELSDEEYYGNYFDPDRLANTLKIDVSDAKLLKSTGKTYVFAKSEYGNVYELYHSSLDCNNLSISISIATQDRIDEFNHEEWASAPYAGLVGQTENKNHFVC